MRGMRIEDELMEVADDLVRRAKQLVKETSSRRLTVRHENKTILEIPLTAGVVGAFLAPQLAALAIFSGILTRCTITVEETKP